VTQRRDLQHTHSMILKLHPDLWQHVDTMSQGSYCTAAEYVRRLIVSDMQTKQRAAKRLGQ
jgi:hypothetical protein